MAFRQARPSILYTERNTRDEKQICREQKFGSFCICLISKGFSGRHLFGQTRKILDPEGAWRAPPVPVHKVIHSFCGQPEIPWQDMDLDAISENLPEKGKSAARAASIPRRGDIKVCRLPQRLPLSSTGFIRLPKSIPGGTEPGSNFRVR
jgi:hypothetical protein